MNVSVPAHKIGYFRLMACSKSPCGDATSRLNDYSIGVFVLLWSYNCMGPGYVIIEFDASGMLLEK